MRWCSYSGSQPTTAFLKNIAGGESMTNYIGNISTIVKWISMYIAGWTIGTLAAYGMNLPIDSTVLSQVIFGFIMLGVGYIDAKFPNTFKFLDNDIEDIDPAGEYERDDYPMVGDDNDGC